MRSHFILLGIATVIICSSCSTKKENIDCTPFRTGKFEYRGLDNERFLMERNDSIQIESDERTGITMKFKINWVEPCVYELIFFSYIKNGKDSIVGTKEVPEYPPVHTRIIKTSKNYYISTSVMEGDKTQFRDTILKVD